MSVLEIITEAFGWCTAINIGVFVLAAILLVPMRRVVVSIHGRMFNLSEDDLSRAYFQYMAQYKIAILVLNLVPYIVLKTMV
jgi:hypothetical protein